MDAILNWLTAGSVQSSIIISLFAFTLAILISIYFIAFLQGRAISFWPPKIGERKNKEGNESENNLTFKKANIEGLYLMIRETHGIVENILQFHIVDRVYEKYGVKLNLTVWGDFEPEEGRPENKDYPHIYFFTTDKISVKQGDTLSILFRIQDEGFNFPFPSSSEEINDFIEITDTSNMTMFPAKYIGRTYYFTQINFPENATLGYHKIAFKLTDLKNNSFTQSLKITVEK